MAQSSHTWFWKFLLPISVAALFTLVFTAWFGEISTWWLNCGITISVSCLLMKINRTMYAHGANGKPHVYGMPEILAMCYVLLFLFTVLLGTSLSENVADNTNYELQAMSFALFVGSCTAFLDWRTFSSQETYFYDETRARNSLKSKGYSEEQIEQHMDSGRRKGIFGPQ